MKTVIHFTLKTNHNLPEHSQQFTLNTVNIFSLNTVHNFIHCQQYYPIQGQQYTLNTVNNFTLNTVEI